MKHPLSLPVTLGVFLLLCAPPVGAQTTVSTTQELIDAITTYNAGGESSIVLIELPELVHLDR